MIDPSPKADPEPSHGIAQTWGELDEPWPNRPTCVHIGPDQTICDAPATHNGLCLNHVEDTERSSAIAAALSSELVDLRGLKLGADLWDELSEGLEAVAFDEPARKQIWLSESVFTVRPEFYGWRFWGALQCDNTRFEHGVNFVAVDFEGDASFAGAFFGASDEASADFEASRFKAGLVLNGATFAGEARFYQSRFLKQVDFQNVTFQSLASFQETEWESAQRLFGRVFLEDEMNLRRATFFEDLLMETEGGSVDFEDARFGDSVTMRARSSKVLLEHVDLTRPALISLAPESKTDQHGSPIVPTAIDFSSTAPTESLPRVESLRNSNVLALTIASADLKGCCFQGARNLDRLSIEGQTLFADAPKWRSRRRVVAEETAWRQRRSRADDGALGRKVPWASGSVWRDAQASSAYQTEASDVQPEQLARIYRGLRKSLEESKDFAGASDFYYGEMETRLRSRSSPWADRAIIAIYWLLSGYGLRANRSLLALAIILMIFAALFSINGFAEDQPMNSFAGDQPFIEGILHSAQSAALLPQGDTIQLTRWGEAYQIALRILGPALIALTALALRARIKR